MTKRFSFSIANEYDVKIDEMQGLNVIQSTEEKRKNHNIVTVNIDGLVINYLLFHIGLYKQLVKACEILTVLINNRLTLAAEKRLQLEKQLVRLLWIVKHHNTETSRSKLDSIWSLSTCCLVNLFCLARMKNPDSVCSHCYACAQQRCQYGLTSHNLINGLILMTYEISEQAYREVMTEKLAMQRVFRIESFGDVSNMIQTKNYINLINAVETVRFAAWTKNVVTWVKTFEQYGKPKNLVFITSSNHVNMIDEWEEYSKWIDHRFTVYDKDGAKKVVISCGGRACMADCIMKGKGCYFHNTEKDIREELK